MYYLNYANLLVSGGTVSAGGTIAANNISITGGTFDASGGGGRTINIAGNWAQSGTGAFTSTNSTVNFINNLAVSTVSGNTTFNILNCSTDGKTLTLGGSNDILIILLFLQQLQGKQSA